MKFNKIKLSNKLLMGFSLMILLIIAVSSLSIFRLNQINKTVTQLTSLENKKVNLANKLKIDIDQISLNIRNIAISNDINYMNQQKKLFDDGKSQYYNDEKQLGELLYTDKGKAMFNDLQTNSQVAFSAFDQAINLVMKTNVSADEYQKMLNDLNNPETQLFSSINSMMDLQNQLMSTQGQLSTETATSSSKQIIFFLILSVIIGILSMYFIKKSIIMQIKEVMIGANKLAEGNFNLDMKVESNDEIGNTVSALNGAVNKLSDIMSVIKNMSQDMFQSSKITNELFSDVSLQIDQISAATEEISAGMEESSAAVDEAASMATNVKEEVNITSKKAQDGLNVALKIQEKAITINNDSVKSRDNAERIYKETKFDLEKALKEVAIVNEILEMANSIDSISKQTNLLALNAAIESARAGEAGKGFAVVAEEVRKLAEQSSEAVSQIQKKVNGVLNSVEKLSSSSQNILSFIENDVLKDYSRLISISNEYKKDGDTVKELIGDFAEVSENIANSVDQISKSMEEVSISVSEVAKSSTNIVSNIIDVTNKNGKILSASNRNEQNALGLEEITGQFQLK